ncbi:MAG: UTRA domain-containing protein [Pseudonocardiales bacterium]|nr:UTRA domain-containing protein [Pseudonocardiales bacterium]
MSWSYYPMDLVTGTALTGQRKIKDGAPAVLAELGHPQRYFTDRVTARLPTSEELEALRLPVDVPVLRQFRVIHSDTRPVEAVILIKGTHKYEAVYHETVAALPDPHGHVRRPTNSNSATRPASDTPGFWQAGRPDNSPPG